MHQSCSSETRVAQVMHYIEQQIATRTLLSGARLPSIRRCAELMCVSKSTVVDAYDRLAASGIIQSRRGSGFYVGLRAVPLSLTDVTSQTNQSIDALWVSRQSLGATKDALVPGSGWLPASWIHESSIRRALRAVARAETSMLASYGTPQGSAELRRLLSHKLFERGIHATPEQILLTESGTQAADLVCRFLIEPGDTVIVDDPCYFNFLALLRAHRAKVVSVPYTPSGPDIDCFAKVLASEKPKLYITNSTFHNPTGATLSPVTMHRLLKLAEQSGLTIIEDDIFADFEYEVTPRLSAFDGFERVIQISSFSKTLSPAVRCGFIVASRNWIEGLTDLKIATSFGGGQLSSELVLSILKDGTYRKHLDGLRGRLARAMGETAGRLKGLGITPWIEPRGGMFLWCQLPEGLDSANISQKALAENVMLAPGNVFSSSLSAGRFLRFNVARSQDQKIFRVLEKLISKA